MQKDDLVRVNEDINQLKCIESNQSITVTSKHRVVCQVQIVVPVFDDTLTLFGVPNDIRWAKMIQCCGVTLRYVTLRNVTAQGDDIGWMCLIGTGRPR
mmetsp:Transcript_26300/g.62537  ORF Transcript_26300/g.62537 Transcript_26300/m.62537 type:complete len:98 (-) Transcript_26300:1626-1919(-)